MTGVSGGGSSDMDILFGYLSFYRLYRLYSRIYVTWGQKCAQFSLGSAVYSVWAQVYKFIESG